MAVDIETIRKAAWNYLSGEVAAVGGMTLAQMQQFLCYRYRPSDPDLQRLAFRLRLTEAFPRAGDCGGRVA